MLFVDVETEKHYSEQYEADLHTFKVGWTWYLRNKGGDCDLTSGEWEEHWDSEEFCEYIDSKTADKSPLYVFGSNVTFDLGASRFFEYFTDAGWQLDLYFNRGMSFILYVKKGKKRIKCLAMQNFLPTSIEKMGEKLGYVKGQVDFETVNDDELSAYCRRDVEILGRSILEYQKFIRDHNLGGFSPTISGQAMRAYRHRFMTEQLLVYHRSDVQRLERKAYFGGRTECFRLGEMPKQLYVKLDVNSMYPHVMQEHSFPVKLVQCFRDMSKYQLDELLQEFCVIAEVEVEAGDPIYPKQINGLTCFPVGTFTTFLCTESLKVAIFRDEIREVKAANVYQKKPIFVDYVDFFWKLRQHYKEVGYDVMNFVTKLFMNSLYGKFGEKRDKVMEDEYTDANDFYRFDYYDEKAKEYGIEECLFHRFRIVQGWKEAPNSMPAIAAHVTDHARLRLWEIIEAFGRKNVLYCDTDSIIVPSGAYEWWPLPVSPDMLGWLKIEGESEHLVLHGCKDYEFGDETHRKGIKDSAVQNANGNFLQTQFPTIIGMLRQRVIGGVPVKEVTKQLHREYRKGYVEDDGSVTPFVLRE